MMQTLRSSLRVIAGFLVLTVLTAQLPAYAATTARTTAVQNMLSRAAARKALRQRRTPVKPAVPAVCGNGKREAAEQCDDGNLDNGDGCSKICVIVPEPVRHAALLVEQQTSALTVDIAQGRRNVTLLQFTALAGRQDAVLTSVTFAPSAGSLLNAQHYTLKADLNNDGSYETTLQRDGKTQSDRLIFDKPRGAGAAIPDGVRIRYAVTADIAQSVASGSFGLRFATTLPDYVTAVGAVDGSPLTGIETDNDCNDRSMCWISVHTAGSTTVSVQSNGNLFVTADPLTVRSRQIVASTVTDELLRLRLRGENEDIDVTSLRFGGVASTVDTLLLYRLKPGERLNKAVHTSFAQATAGQCDTSDGTLCAAIPRGTLALRPDDEAVIAVAARLKSDYDGAVSGQSFAVSLNGVHANGRSSMKQLEPNDGDDTEEGEIFIGVSAAGPNATVMSPTHDTVLAGIASVSNGRPESVSPFVPVGLTTFAAFRIQAAQHANTRGGSDDVTVKSLVFRVTAQNVQMDLSGFTLASAASPSTRISCSAGAATGSFDVTCTGIDIGAVQSRIGQGEELTYLLTGTVLNPQLAPGSSTLMAELASLSPRGTSGTIVWTDGTTTFTWVDMPEQVVRSTTFRQ